MNIDSLENTRSELFTSLVQLVMRIDSTTWGTNQQKYLVRFQGELRMESELAYDQLSEALRSHDVTPLFRVEDGQHTILLLEGVIKPKRSNPLVNLVLFIFTVISVLFAGALYAYSGPVTDNTLLMLQYVVVNIWRGWPFAVSLLAIILAHEFGHYLAQMCHVDQKYLSGLCVHYAKWSTAIRLNYQCDQNDDE